METWSVNGIELAVIAEGSGPLVVLAHGFPDLALTWRLQVPALVAAGYRVVAPDMRGYGASSRPEPVEAYRSDVLGDDLVGLLDHEGGGARPRRRARLGCGERVATRTDAPRPVAVAHRPQRPLRAAVARTTDRDLSPPAGGGLLHAPLPHATT